MSARNQNISTMSCLIINQNLDLLKNFINSINISRRHNHQTILQVDSVQFQYSPQGLWVRTQIIPEPLTTPKIQKNNHYQQTIQAEVQTDTQFQQLFNRAKNLSQILVHKDKKIQELVVNFKQVQQKIKHLETQYHLSQKSNQRLSQKILQLNTALNNVLETKKNFCSHTPQVYSDDVQLIEVQYNFEVSVQTQELNETARIKQLEKTVQQLKANIANSNFDSQIIEQEVCIKEVEVQTNFTMTQIQKLISRESFNSGTQKQSNIIQKPKEIPQVKSQERKNYHKRGMDESENRNKKYNKQIKKQLNDNQANQKIKVVQKIVEVPKIIEKQVQKVIEKVIQVPIDRIIQVFKDRIIQVPIQKVVQKIVEKQIQIPVQKLITLEVQKIVEVPIQKMIYVDKIVQIYNEKVVQVPVQKIIQVQKIVNVQKIKEVQKYIEVPIEKVVQIQKQILKIVEVQRIVQKNVNHMVEVPVEVKIIQKQPYPVQTLLIVQTQRYIEVPKEPVQSSPIKYIDLQESQIASSREVGKLEDEITEITVKYNESLIKNKSYEIQILDSERQIQKLSAQIRRTQEQLEQTRRQSRNIAIQSDSQINQYMHLKDKIQSQLQLLKTNSGKLQQKLAQQQEKRTVEGLGHQKDMDSLIEQLSELKQYIQSLKTQILQSQQKANKMDDERIKLEYQNQMLKQNNRRIQEDLSAVEKDAESLFCQLKQKDQQVNTLLTQQQQKQEMGKSVYQEHMRNLIEKYEELQEKNQDLKKQLQHYLNVCRAAQDVINEITKQRDLLFEKLVQIENRIPEQKDVENETQLLDALESARKQIQMLKQYVEKLQNLEKSDHPLKEGFQSNYHSQIIKLKQQLIRQSKNTNLVNHLYILLNKYSSDFNRLQNHCEQLRQLVVEYELRLQNPKENQQQEDLKNLLEKVVNQLEKERFQKQAMEQDIEKMNNTLCKYQQIILQRDQEINYYRLMLSEKYPSKYLMKSSRSNDSLLKKQYDSNRRGQKQYVLDDLSYQQKQKKMGQNVNAFAYNRQRIKHEISKSNIVQRRFNGISKTKNQQTPRVYDKQINLKNLIQTGYISKLSMLIIMKKIAQSAQEQLKYGPVHLTTSDIIIKNFQQLSPQHAQVQINNTSDDFNPLYSSPEQLSGLPCSESSVVWNLGMIFDELIHKRLFYSSTTEILNPEDDYRFKNMAMSQLKKTVTKAVLKNPQQRISLANLIFCIGLDIRKTKV